MTHKVLGSPLIFCTALDLHGQTDYSLVRNHVNRRNNIDNLCSMSLKLQGIVTLDAEYRSILF